MIRWILAVGIAVTATSLTGCVPKRIAWSPDGQQAAVVDDDGCLRLGDADCEISDVLIEDVADCLTPVVWFPDSQRMLVVRLTAAARWADVSQWLSDDRRAVVQEQAKRLRAEILAYKDDWASFDPASYRGLTPAERDAALLYLRGQSGTDWPEASKKWHDWDEEFLADVWTIEIFESAKEKATRVRVVTGSLDEIVTVLLSPNGNTVAYTRQNPWPYEEDSFGLEELDLHVAPTDREGVSRRVAWNVSAYPAWSPDGTHLVYAASETSGSNGVSLGNIARRQVCSAEGQLLDEFGDSEDLAGLLFSPMLRVCCLSDGRILFASLEVALPTTASDVPDQMSLFMLDLRRQPTITRVLTRQAASRLPNGLGMGAFELSPDETRLAVAGEHDAVAILDLASGQVSVVHPADESTSKGILTMPTWRSNEELCFAVPPGSELGSEDWVEIVLWSKEETRCISEDWPDVGW